MNTNNPKKKLTMKDVLKRLDRRCEIEPEEEEFNLYINAELVTSGNEAFIIDYVIKNKLLMK